MIIFSYTFNHWKMTVSNLSNLEYLASTTGSSTSISVTYIVFVTKMQKSKPPKKDLPFLKTISQQLQGLKNLNTLAYSIGPNSSTLPDSSEGKSASIGPNISVTSLSLDGLLDWKDWTLFLRTGEDRMEIGIGLRDFNRFSGINILTPITIRFGSSVGFALDRAFQFFQEPVYHCAMMDSVSPGQRTLCI